MNKSETVDATVAKLMACLPASERWHNDPLDPRVLRVLECADEQTLLSIAVYSLRMIAEMDVEG
jgi:hypothetical protein